MTSAVFVAPTRGRGRIAPVGRVDAVGGSVTITSPAGTGAVLRAVLPIEVA